MTTMQTCYVHVTDTSPLVAFGSFADCERSVQITWSRVRGVTFHAERDEADGGDFTIIVRNELGDEIGRIYFRHVRVFTKPTHL